MLSRASALIIRNVARRSVAMPTLTPTTATAASENSQISGADCCRGARGKSARLHCYTRSGIHPAVPTRCDAVVSRVDCRSDFSVETWHRTSRFHYCVHLLHFAEGVAYKRIAVARAARQFPELLAALESGGIHLTGASLIAPHLGGGSTAEWLAIAIPVAIRRAVWARDAGRCCYRSQEGRQCGSQEYLEFHHQLPWPPQLKL